MPKNIERLRLLDPEKVIKDRIAKNKMKYVLGGYGNIDYFIRCKRINQIGDRKCLIECTGSCSWCRNKAIDDGCIEDTIEMTPDDC